jgi:hypothetical protein
VDASVNEVLNKVNTDDGSAIGKVELKKLLTEVIGAVMLHLSVELIFFHAVVVGGASRRNAIVAFPHALLYALVIVIFTDKEMPALSLKNARFCIGQDVMIQFL